ncbi:phospholipase, partial [Escherichia coli]
MGSLQGWLVPGVMLPMAGCAQEATGTEVQDAPAVRGRSVAYMLQADDYAGRVEPYVTNYRLCTQTSEV